MGLHVHRSQVCALPSTSTRTEQPAHGTPREQLGTFVCAPAVRLALVSARQVPLPLALLGGFVAGALMYRLKRRPVYYEVQEDDTLCHIASCFKKKVEDVYQRNKTLLKSHRLYPGDRLRIQ
jgi:hypothetical protein